MQIESNHTICFDSKWPIEEVRTLLGEARRTVLVAHQNADGDAVGSVCGMAGLLRRQARCAVQALLPDGVPEELRWVPGASLIIGGEEQQAEALQAIAEADLIIGLDLNAFSRAGRLAEALTQSKAHKLLVDHHIGPHREEMTAVVSEPEASSTCELVYWLGRTLYGTGAFDTDSAAALYTGLCTDTGTFAFSNRHPSLYLAAAELLSYGIDPARINRSIRNVFTTQRLRFFGFAMANRMEVYEEQQVVLIVLTQNDMQRFGVQSSELTGLINEVMRLRDIDCGILMRESEEPSTVRLSLRSKERYDVNQIAAELFEGGGHIRAAGATSHLSLQATVQRVRERMGLPCPPPFAEETDSRTKEQ